MTAASIAVVTGAARGIGRAVTRRLVAAGSRVVAVDLDARGLDQLAQQLPAESVRVVPADVSTAEGVASYVDAAVDEFGGIDVFHNNAGIEGTVATLDESDVDAFDRVMRVNVRGVYLGLHAVLQVMRARGRGAVVNTASVAGLRGRVGLGPYVASKHAVLGLTRTAALEAAEYGVRVNAVCPGPVRTEMIERIDASALRAGEGVGTSTLCRYGTADEVAAVVCWLLGDESAFVTGGAYPVDGGRTAV
ncbi:MAG: SDR family oxidoreductase [Streptosporangiales bacterium]|nr:SDR family oxidoreductase [Streptosporangiales bacterium]